MADYKKLLGKNIQKFRKAKGITQEKLAELIGIETPSLSCLETGKFTPSIETLQKLCETLYIKPWELYYFEPLTDKEMREEIVKKIDNNQKLLQTVYHFCKSVS